MSALPDGWTTCAISELLEHTIGGVWGSPTGEDEVDVDVFRVTEFGRYGVLNPDTAARRSISKRQLLSRELRDGDLLLEKSGGGPTTPVGRVVGVVKPRRQAVPTNFVQLLRPRSELAPRLVLWLLVWEYTRGTTEKFQRATTNIRNLQTKDYLDHPVALPPVAEQARIVAAIEEHFSHLDAAEALLRRAQRSLERLRLATLMDICSGTWPVQQLGAFAASLRNGMFVSRPAADPPGLPIFRISAVRPLALDSGDVRYADVSAEDAAPYQVEEDDVLFTRYSGNPSYVGACAVVPAGAAGTLHPDKLIRVSLDQAVALPSWVAVYLSVGAGRAQIDARLKTTAGQVGIAGGQLKTVEVPLPPIDEQARRIARWDAASDQMSALSSDIEKATRRASNLRRSILAAAFSGQLVQQDVADEPAEALLERIREAVPAHDSSRKRKHA